MFVVTKKNSLLSKQMIISFLVMIVLVSIFCYFNLLVSEKYETQLEGLNASIEDLEGARILYDKIQKLKYIVISIILICSILIGFILKKYF